LPTPIDEAPIGTINGSNSIFTLSQTPVAGGFSLFLNGQRLESGTDFTLSGTTITYNINEVPQVGDTHRAVYNNVSGGGGGGLVDLSSRVAKSGDTMTGLLVTAPSGAGAAGFRLTPGSDPVSPTDGDIWMNRTSVFFRVSGVTVQLTNFLQSQNANTFFAGPTTGSGEPTFRALAAGDIPQIPYAKIIDPPTLTAAAPAFSTTTTATSFAIDFTSGQAIRVISALASACTFTTSNLFAGSVVGLRIKDDGLATRALTFPATWTWLTAPPTSTVLSKWLVITLESLGTTDGGVLADWKSQP
jgi:hypothetical protein